MNNKKIYTIGTVPKSTSKIVERGKMDTHKYMTAHVSYLVQSLQ